jgi:hypothetical protein
MDFDVDEKTPMCALGTRLMRYRFRDIPEYAEFETSEGILFIKLPGDSILNAKRLDDKQRYNIRLKEWIRLTKLVRCECGTFVAPDEECDCEDQS